MLYDDSPNEENYADVLFNNYDQLNTMVAPTSETEEQVDAGVIKLKQQKSSEMVETAIQLMDVKLL